MKTDIIRAGDWYIVRIPKRLLDRIGIEGEVKIHAQQGSLVIGSLRKPREGWEKAFRALAQQDFDRSTGAAMNVTRWDDTEWEW